MAYADDISPWNYSGVDDTQNWGVLDNPEIMGPGNFEPVSEQLVVDYNQPRVQTPNYERLTADINRFNEGLVPFDAKPWAQNQADANQEVFLQEKQSDWAQNQADANREIFLQEKQFANPQTTGYAVKDNNSRFTNGVSAPLATGNNSVFKEVTATPSAPKENWAGGGMDTLASLAFGMPYTVARNASAFFNPEHRPGTMVGQAFDYFNKPETVAKGVAKAPLAKGYVVGDNESKFTPILTEEQKYLDEMAGIGFTKEEALAEFAKTKPEMGTSVKAAATKATAKKAPLATVNPKDVMDLVAYGGMTFKEAEAMLRK